ncbi:1-deoxy-D-xylulose-5-phosphate reductoisomerase [Tepidamorphus sp. 3E244]|uniref:1-deoxy-D-xylulose-5-phosphate reductoisomerase n=1 Tax=Tepidamorphus sp. 3E244 TaxID=3385498 RepID=UPI0038FCCA2E
MTRRRLTILGATGSVGTSTLDLVSAESDRFEIDTLTANRDVEGLARLAITHKALHAVVADEACYDALKVALSGHDITVAAGRAALCEAATRPVDMVVAAIVGVAGLAPALAAARTQPMVALANKESLVCAGSLFMRDVGENATVLVPVDSEHSALLQALGGPAIGGAPDLTHVSKLVITASGGPFRTLSAGELARVTPQQALAHPVWSMGSKISIDSASLMNKALELIEAKYLFGIDSARLDVLVHPQSIIHGLVHYRDGSVVAQMANPDMKVPIALALAWPQRMDAQVDPLDLAALGSLTFEQPDRRRFPALGLARQLLEADGGCSAVVNGANELAVDRFLAGAIGFTDIVAICEATLDSMAGGPLGDPQSLDDAMALDAEARRKAGELAARPARSMFAG